MSVIRDIFCFNKYEKRDESDLQMVGRVARKFVVWFFFFLAFDTLLDWSIALFDIILELLHLAIDFVEYSVEILLEHVFHTGHYDSEIIIVNTAILVFIFLVYFAYKKAPILYQRWKNKLMTAYAAKKAYEAACWHALTLTRKIKVVAMYCVCITCFLFLVTL